MKLSCLQGGNEGGDVLGELIRKGLDTGDNGPEWDAIFVDLREAVDPGRLPAKGCESMV